MSKKLAKKRQPVKPVVAKEPARTAKNFGYEEMLSELEAIVADAETRLAEDEATARDCLELMSGRRHRVLSAIALRAPDNPFAGRANKRR